jgi:muconate cycloisomerase
MDRTSAALARKKPLPMDEAQEWASGPITIRRVEAIPMALPLKKPMKMAGVTIVNAENLLVRIESADGSVGWGEAASAPTMTGDILPGMVAAVSAHLGPALVGQDARFRPSLMQSLDAALYGNTGAKAAIDMALIDLIGRLRGVSFSDLIGGVRRTSVRPMCLVGNMNVAEDVAEARARLAEGYAFFKLKVASKPLEQDIEATHAMRAALGRDIPLCADANQGFTREQARRYLDATRDAGLLFLEQPIAGEDVAGMAALARATGTPLAADEGIHRIGDLETHAREGAASGASLKFIKLGGVGALLRAAAMCEARGLFVNVAGKVAESGIASAAVVHAGCAVHDAAWGVSVTDMYLQADVVDTPLRLRADGAIAAPEGPGLGVTVNESAVRRLRTTWND